MLRQGIARVRGSLVIGDGFLRGLGDALAFAETVAQAEQGNGILLLRGGKEILHSLVIVPFHAAAVVIGAAHGGETQGEALFRGQAEPFQGLFIGLFRALA